MPQIEVFKTNISSHQIAQTLIEQITFAIPNALATCDLEDCDRILRVEAINLDTTKVMAIAQQLGIWCEVLL